MGKTIGRRIIRLKKVDSTNTYIKKNINLLREHGLVIIAEMQTSGRGRFGRKFISLPNNNVTFSVILHPNLPFDKVQVFSLLAGIVVARVLEKYIDNVQLKWPNDVLVNGKKICGILIETIKIDNYKYPFLILGIGINTRGFSKDYPLELKNIVTTLEEEFYKNIKKKEFQRANQVPENEKIFQDILQELEKYIFINKEDEYKKNEKIENELHHKFILKEWLERSKSIGLKVRISDNINDDKKSFENIGTIEGLTDKGYLKIRTESGKLITHISGEIIEIN